MFGQPLASLADRFLRLLALANRRQELHQRYPSLGNLIRQRDRPAQAVFRLDGIASAGGEDLSQPEVIAIVLGIGRDHPEGHLHRARGVLVLERHIDGQPLPIG